MAGLYGVVPPIMAWRLRYGAPLSLPGMPVPAAISAAADGTTAAAAPAAAAAAADSASVSSKAADISETVKNQEWVPGGRVVLALLCGSAVAIEIGQLTLDLPWF